MKGSLLQIWSIGTVAANKPLDTTIIDVTPDEEVPFLDGEINADKTTSAVKSQDQDGKEYQVSMVSSNAIKAEWLPLGEANRKTAPDVRRGATVVIYRFGDTEKYYWTTMKADLHLRKLETVIWAFSGTKDEGAGVTTETTYFLELSTHKGQVTFHTSKANGEPFSYTIQINTKEGFIKFQDDAKNFFIIDSSEKQIAMHNGDGSYIDVNKKDITINAVNTFKLTAKDAIFEVANSITENTKTYKTTASTQTITATTTHKGTTAHLGAFALTGNMTTTAGEGGTGKASFGSDIDVKGAVLMQQSVNVSGTLTAAKIISTQPIEAPNVK